MSRKDILLALLVPCLLGFGFVIAKPAMESFPPILLNGLRWSLSGLLMCYFFPFPKNFIKQMFAISIIGGSIQYSLSFYGLNILDGASATLFVQAEIPFGVVNRLEDLKDDPQLKSLDFFREYNHPTEGKLEIPDSAFRYNRHSLPVRRHQPKLGEQSEEILKEAGFNSDEISKIIDN